MSSSNSKPSHGSSLVGPIRMGLVDPPAIGLLKQSPNEVDAKIAAILARRSGQNDRSLVDQDIEAVRARCRTFAGFVREAWHVLEPAMPYIHGWHIDFICAHLEAVTYGTFLKMGLYNRLQFNVPPGTMKSLLISVLWQAWEWGPCNMPAMRYLSTSWNEVYVKRDTRKTRDLIQSEWYQKHWPHIKLVRVGETSFANTATGGREGVPFSSLTSGRGDRLTIDDPHSTETAESPTEIETATRIFRESVPLRVNDPILSAIILVMQRLSENDLSGVQQKLKLNYVTVILPMEFEVERRCVSPLKDASGKNLADPRTYDDELLFPERFPRAVVERDKVPLGSYGIAGQLQQRPSPRGGGKFKRGWFEIVRAMPVGGQAASGWDLAASKHNTSPWTARVRGKEVNGTYYIDAADRLRGSPSEVDIFVLNLTTQDAMIHGKEMIISIPQDPGQAAKGQVVAFAKLLKGYNARFSPETGSKEARATPMSAQAEAGNIKLVSSGDPDKDAWITMFLDELSTFPTGEFKDLTDAASRWFAALLLAPPPPPQASAPILIRG